MLSTSTFIGYQLSGLWGALAATTGIFLPSFIFVMILNPIFPKLQGSKVFRYFLDSVNVAAVAVMFAVLLIMGKETLLDWRTILVTLTSTFFVFSKWKLNVMWLILGGAILGYLLLLL